VAAAVLVAGGISVALWKVSSDHHPSKDCGKQGCAAQQPTAAAPVTKLRYQTVERDTGYFEGTVMLVNRGDKPVTAWTLSFTYPGADIRNAWDVDLRQKGSAVVIANAPTAAPIAPGHSFEVRFGGAGRPGTPTACRLNGAPCTFVK
jgi:hypothetical protein